MKTNTEMESLNVSLSHSFKQNDMNKFSLILILFALIAFSCETESLSYDNSQIIVLEKELSDAPSKGAASKLVVELSNQAAAETTSKEDKKVLLEKALKVCSDHNMASRSTGFLMNLIKDYSDDPKTSEHLFVLARSMKIMKNEHAADVLFHSYITNFPEASNVASAKEQMSSTDLNVDTLIYKLGETIFENPDQYGLNRSNAQKYVDACEAYALGNPKSERAPLYLYKASEIARSLRTFPKTMSLYDWIIEKFPNYDKAPTTLFLKGFVLENEMGNTEMAKEVYQQFIEKYPDHTLKDDVQFLLDNIGKSNEEILELIESKKQKNSES